MTESERTYDIVVLVGQKDLRVAFACLTHLARFLNYGKMIVITARSNFVHLEHLDVENLVLLDENSIIPSIHLEDIENFLLRHGATPHRAGWYFQQFLKMAMCAYEEMSAHYLVWDADTVLLQPLSFFTEEGRVLVAMAREYHEPYFRTYERLLNDTRSVDFSFIAEHLMVRSELMKGLLKEIDGNFPGTGHWVWRIMRAIDTEHLSSSGFSEYETYGNYVNRNFRDTVEYRRIPSLRGGARRFGCKPNRYDLHRLSREYQYVSFERSEVEVGKRSKLALEKTLSFLLYYLLKEKRSD